MVVLSCVLNQYFLFLVVVMNTFVTAVVTPTTGPIEILLSF